MSVHRTLQQFEADGHGVFVGAEKGLVAGHDIDAGTPLFFAGKNDRAHIATRLLDAASPDISPARLCAADGMRAGISQMIAYQQASSAAVTVYCRQLTNVYVAVRSVPKDAPLYASHGAEFWLKAHAKLAANEPQLLRIINALIYARRVVELAMEVQLHRIPDLSITNPDKYVEEQQWYHDAEMNIWNNLNRFTDAQLEQLVARSLAMRYCY